MAVQPDSRCGDSQVLGWELSLPDGRARPHPGASSEPEPLRPACPAVQLRCSQRDTPQLAEMGCLDLRKGLLVATSSYWAVVPAALLAALEVAGAGGFAECSLHPWGVQSPLRQSVGRMRTLAERLRLRAV